MSDQSGKYVTLNVGYVVWIRAKASAQRSTPVSAKKLCLRAYVTSLEGGFHVFDLSDPAHPDLLGQYESRGWFPKLAISGNYAYLASADWGGGLSGLEVIEIAEPANARLVAAWDSSSWDSSYADYFVPTKLIVAGDLV